MSGGYVEEKDLLAARIEDAIEKSERGTLAVLPFLTPRDQKRADKMLRARGVRQQAWFWGGYPEAERTSLFLLPEYLTVCLTGACDAVPAEEMRSLLGEEAERAVCAVRIVGSGFRKLGHRDFLGSVLGLGIERDVLGDLAVQNEHEAVLFCTEKMATFLKLSLEKVASDTVRCIDQTEAHGFTDGRHYQPIRDTVASERLDCVVAALCNLSRDAAQTAVRTGLVEVDFEVTERVDMLLAAPCTISVRGQGRFVLRAFDGETRKGRLRLCADRLI